jgi:predicted Zn-dependent protease
VRLVSDYGINAFADGEEISVTTGMLRFVNNDDELALVIGHELAHNVLGHPDYERGRKDNPILHGMTEGALLDATLATAGTYGRRGRALTGIGGNTGKLAFFQVFEREANDLGLYFVQRAGFDPSQAVDLWRRMGMKAVCQVPGPFERDSPPSSGSDTEFY